MDTSCRGQNASRGKTETYRGNKRKEIPMTTRCPYCGNFYEVSTEAQAADPDRMCATCFLAEIDRGPEMEEERV